MTPIRGGRGLRDAELAACARRDAVSVGPRDYPGNARWGSLSPSGRLLLNCRLIEAPPDAIDYVIAREPCHLAEPHHGAAFYRLLGRVMPDWEERTRRLEVAMA